MAIAPVEFRCIVETHQRMVFSIALRITGHYGTAEEVAQDVFLELHRALPALGPKLAGEDHLRAWLRRVSVHRSTDALRRRRVQPTTYAEAIEDHEPSTGPAGSTHQFAMEARLADLLRSLPEPQRVAVVLRFGESLWPEEIAALLGQPLATVKSNLQRGLALLRRKAAVTLKEYVREQL